MSHVTYATGAPLTILKAEFDAVHSALTLTETEETWDTIAKGITRLTQSCSEGIRESPSELVTLIREVSHPLINAMNSERSRLSGAAIDLVNALASGLGGDMETLLPVFMPPLLLLCTRASKVTLNRARSSVLSLIDNTQLPAVLPYLVEASRDKAISLRIVAADGVLSCLNCFNPPDLERETRAKMVEDVIRTTAKDASADVRKVSKKVFEAYKALLPGRVDKFVAPLTPIMKKYLDIKPKQVDMQIKAPDRVAGQLKAASQMASTSSTLSRVKPEPASVNLSRPAKSRSASTSTLQTLVGGQKQSDMSDMLPPRIIPVRRVPPSRPPIATSQSAPTAEARTKAPAMRVPSSDALPSRPPSAATKSSQRAVPEESAVARRVKTKQTETSLPSSNITNCPECTGNTSRPMDGPVRPVKGQTSNGIDSKTRVVGGARRVPLPPKENITDSGTKAEHVDVHAMSESVVTNDLSTASTRLIKRAESSKSGITDTHDRPKPVPKPVPKVIFPVHSSSRSSSRQDTKLPQAKPSRTDASARSKVIPKSSGVMEPTLAQIARAKAASEERKHKEEKPLWGRQAPTKSKPPFKTRAKLPIKPTAQTIPTAMDVALNLPLPPSSRYPTSPNSVPVPQSPTCLAANTVQNIEIIGQFNDEAYSGTEQETVLMVSHKKEVQIADAAGQVDSTSHHAEAHAPIPSIQEPYNSTPTFPELSPVEPIGTPISTLLSSIQQGFLFTPCSPLSPPQSYVLLPKDDSVDSISPTPLARLQPMRGSYFTHTHRPQNENSDTSTKLAGALETRAISIEQDGRLALSEVELN